MTVRPTALLICVNHRFGTDKPSCAARGSLAVAEAVETGVAQRRIDLAVERIICLGQCTKGPSMRLAPGGEFLLGVDLVQVPGILDRLERLCGHKSEEAKLPPLHLLGS